jgi:uncharacterized protein YfaS (alpha-2-macroglobulin family)
MSISPSPRFSRSRAPVELLRATGAFLAFLGGVLLAAPGDDLLEQANKQFELKNYKDARVQYEDFIQKAPEHPKLQEVVNQVIACRLRMQEFAEALDFAKGRIEKDKGTIWEIRSHRRYGNLLMSAPHWGMRRAGEFHRAKHGQGEFVNSFRKDRREAIDHLESARTLYLQFLAAKEKLAALPKEDQEKFLPEALECNFDLAGSLLRRKEQAQSWDWWDDFGEQDEEIEDYEVGQGYQRRQIRGSTPPAGLKVDKEGQPIFTPTPAAYDPKLPDDQRVRYLLKEIEAKDPTPEHGLKALAIYRRAMVARARFGPDLVSNWWQQGHRRFGALGKPVENDPAKPEKELWELKENEALTWIAGELRVISLPPEEDIVALLSTVGHEYSKTDVADDALYALGAFFQTRQQYPRALEAYEELIGKFPETSYRQQADNARQQIRNNEVHLHEAGAQLSGQKAKLQVSYRNASRIRLTVQPIDLPAFIARIDELNDKVWSWEMKDLNGLPPNVTQMTNPHTLAYFLLDPQFNRYQKSLTGQPTVWETQVQDDGTMRPAQTIVETPIDKPGTYFVEATVNGVKMPSRTLVILSDLAIIEKTISNKKLYYLADAVTGAPLENREFTVYETWTEGRQTGNRWEQVNHVTKHPAKSNDAGLFELSLPPIQNRNRCLFATAHLPAAGAAPAGVDQAAPPKTRFAFTQMNYWQPHDPVWQRDNQARIYIVTDRPVYRPKDTVRFKIWVRKKQDGAYVSSAGLPLQVQIQDARGNKIAEHNWKADDAGSADGSLVLGEEPPLGQYQMNVQWREGNRTFAWGGANWRVEEYKKPEFEVSVKPGSTHSRLGQPITAVIEARYYFGAPVTEATVSYKVFRESFQHSYVPTGRYDWLYGPGYGIVDYPYDWFPWWRRWGYMRVSPPWYSWQLPAARQLIKQGEAAIASTGKIEIQIETADALRDHSDSDHRYQIQAEVTDRSRRTITGSGSVSATRQSYYAYVNLDRGWLRPNDQVTVEVVTLTPDSTPVATKGTLSVSQVKYQGRRNDEIVEKVEKEFEVATDDTGRAALPLQLDRSGQFRLSFKAKDPWGGEVQGNSILWIAGDDFDGNLYRFNNLEVLTDKREYGVGEIAHVLINVAEPDSYVLFSSDAFSGVLKEYQLLHLPKKSKVIDVTVKQLHEPNFFVEATTIRNGSLHQMSRELAVPTKRHFLDVQVKAEKAQYAPGTTGQLQVEVKDHTGKPVQTELAMAAFDRSILYIQPETFQKIEPFFHGTKRYHNPQSASSLNWFFQAFGGGVSNPSWATGGRDWMGFWVPGGIYWQEACVEQIAQLGGRGGGFGGVEFAAKGERKAGAALPMAPGAANAVMAMDAVVAGADRAEAEGGALMEKQALRQNRRALQDGADKAKADAGGEAETFVEAQVRSYFADTALWAPKVPTDAAGKASVPITFPESLTTWKVNAWAISPTAQVGHGTASTITTKNLLVRLQAPRFFVERDEVILSANVHNYLNQAKKVKAELAFGEPLFSSETPAVQMIDVPASGEKRVDWKIRVLREGLAKITVKALTNEESDAMQLAFPVFVHGIEKQVAQVGSIPADKDDATLKYEFVIPEDRNPEATRLTVRIAPTLAGAILDSLPYLFDYEYDTVESTLSRFLPAIIVKRTLKETGLDLEAIEAKRRDMPKPPAEHRYGYWTNPVFDTNRLNQIVDTCLKRVLSWQQGNGGWGWWGSGQPSVYQTCYVLYCLTIAKKAGIDIQPQVIERGMSFIEANLEQEYGAFDKGFHTSHAYACYVLSLGGRKKDDWLNVMFDKRDRLNNYGKSLLCLAYQNVGNTERSNILLQNIEQFLKQDNENETAWFETPSDGWWWWWNNDIENNAWVLQCYSAIKPKAEQSRRLVKWLLNNRRHGHYWNSTRDTALTVNAFAEYMKASGELAPNYELTVSVDNGTLAQKAFKVSPDNMFFFDNLLTLSGETIGPGRHTIQVTKKGKGAAYISTTTAFFTKEEDIQGAGLELKIDRTYFKLVPKTKTVDVTTTTGGKVAEQFANYERVPLKTGEELTSGDLIEVEMRVKSKNDYDYLVFEDMKPGGCEPVEVRSGSTSQEGLWAHMELRDAKVAFFIQMLNQGEHRLRYRLRAEIPGKFHALPTKGYGMYAPDLYGTANEMRLGIKDK